jgi:hypothetical protein
MGAASSTCASSALSSSMMSFSGFTLIEKLQDGKGNC